MTVPAAEWIKMRLAQKSVVEEDGKWKANLRGQDLGVFATKAEAFRVYRKAAAERFSDVPSAVEVDAALKAELQKR